MSKSLSSQQIADVIQKAVGGIGTEDDTFLTDIENKKVDAVFSAQL